MCDAEKCIYYKPKYECRWILNGNKYRTDCMVDGVIETNNIEKWNYCPYCKKKVVIKIFNIESGRDYGI